jgi:tetratricopeptide (TPR) repeat protein
MVFSSSDQESEQLGNILLASGRLSADQHQNALSFARKTGKSLGAVLVEMQYLSPQELVQAVYQRVEAVIMSISAAWDAKFFFAEEELPNREVVMLRLNPFELLYRGAKKAVDVDMLKKTYLLHGLSVAPSQEMGNIISRVVFDEQDRQVLLMINGKTSMKDILLHSPFTEEETLRSVNALFNAQALDLETENRAQYEEEKGDLMGQEEMGPQLEPGVADKVDRLFREHKALGYRGVLGLGRNATLQEIKRAYHSMAKEYHPDRYLHIHSDTLKDKLNVIFAYLSEAYRELTRAGAAASGPKTSVNDRQAPQTDNKGLARMKFREGRRNLDNQDYESAMTFLGQAVYLDDSVPDYHFYYGVALSMNRKIREAEVSIRKALDLSPDNADYITELGNIYLKLGFRTRAMNAFKKALGLNPYQLNAAEGLTKASKLTLPGL